MEIRDLYDENKQLTGRTIYKDEPIPDGSFILMVVAFIQNSDGKFLIQKRSEAKGGEWAFTGGHPKSGETSLDGVITEIREELGIYVENPTLFKEAQGKNSFCDLYYIKKDVDIDDIVIQEEEVEKVAFATIEEIDNLMKDGVFKKGHYMMFQDCLNYLN